jgi:hypothetical protein
LGAFQDYRLFDWIDDKNFQAHFKIQNASTEVSPSDELFPDSVRGYLAQAYVLGLPWMPIPEEGRAAIRYSLLSRAAGRYCEKHPLAQVSLAVAIDRVTPESSSPTELSYNSLMDFRCQAKNSDAVSISYIAPLVPLSL